MKPHPITVCKLTVATWNQTHLNYIKTYTGLVIAYTVRLLNRNIDLITRLSYNYHPGQSGSVGHPGQQ